MCLRESVRRRRENHASPLRRRRNGRGNRHIMPYASFALRTTNKILVAIDAGRNDRGAN